MIRAVPFLLLIPLGAQERILWRDPGRTLTLNPAVAFKVDPPRPPFRFVREDYTGSNPKVVVRDAAGVEWRVKGGREIKAETFSSRLAAALGYYAEPSWFVPRGRIEGASALNRAKGFIQPDGSFVDAAFERRDPSLRFLTQDWSWNQNPFKGTPELQGLKVLMMLLSNWDNKDARNRAIGSNTGILERREGARAILIYFVNDWGQTLGSWGSEMRDKSWDCPVFTSQSRDFVAGLEGNRIRFGFVGIHTADFSNDIAPQDVRWLLALLDRIPAEEIRRSLRDSGATPREASCFAAALRSRINQLREASAE